MPQLAIAAAAVLFGTSFLVVKGAVVDVGPVPFLAVRFLLGGVFLAPFALRATPGSRTPGLWRAGTICGAVLLAGYVFQTVGLQYTTASVSAFITYLLVVMVPVMAAIALRRPPALPTSIGVVVATVGLFLLAGGTYRLGRGELLTLGCAIAFAAHIVLLADLAPRFDTARLNAVQMLVVGGGCAVPGLFLGGYDFTARAWFAAVYSAAAVSALAFGLQVWGQRRVGPTHTALLLMIEPVSAAALGYVSNERLDATGWLGAFLILLGIVISEVRVLGRREAPAD